MKHVYTSIDIGSDTIKVVVCELFNNKLNLLAASSVKSRGIKKGLITDGHEASISLKQALTDVEDMLGIKIKKVLATIPNYFSEFIIVPRLILSLPNFSRRVKRESSIRSCLSAVLAAPKRSC